MAETSKYDLLLNDLDSIESKIEILTGKIKETSSENKDLLNNIENLKDENLKLHQAINSLENEIEKLQGDKEFREAFRKIDIHSTEDLKNKLKELITKIDYHLGSYT